MKIFLNILFLIAIICFLPVEAFGFFAAPDNHVYSMPFGVQDNNPGLQPLVPGGPASEFAQKEQLQNFPFQELYGPSPKENLKSESNQPRKTQILNFIMWPSIALVFIAVFIFLRRKLQE